MAQTPASRLRQQFDSYDDMVDHMTQRMVLYQGSADYIGSAAKTLYRTMQPLTNRLPHKMVVDCVYLTCNAEGIRITTRGMQDLTYKLFKVKIRPEPYKWVSPHLDKVCEILMCGPGDLPLRGATGATMESSSGSSIPTK